MIVKHKVAERDLQARSEGRTGLSGRELTAFLLIVIMIVLYAVLFAPPHMGAANNGDFGRFAERVSINNFALLPEGEEYPYFFHIYENWEWEPLDWRLLTPIKQSFGNIWPITFIRLLTNLFGDTAENPFSTFYLAIAYAGMFVIAALLLIRCAVHILNHRAMWFAMLAMIVLMGSMHLAWLNSFYGEAMLYVGLLLSLGFLLTLICFHHSPWAGIGLLLALCMSNYLFLTGKPQGVLAWPFWMVMIVVVTIHLCRKTVLKHKRTFAVICALIVCAHTVYSGIACLNLYRWNNEHNEEDTIYSSIMYGALTLTSSDEEAEAMLEDMGLDPSLAADKGKHAYIPKEELHVAPRSEEAQIMIYDKINTFGVLKYYLTHPKYLYQAMEITTAYAAKPAVSLLMFEGQTKSLDAAPCERFALWQQIRAYLVPQHFWQYVVAYLLLLAISVRSLIRYGRKGEKTQCLMVLVYLLIMATGVIQFPLPFIGNGHADTNKQLYLFMLCWDITMLVTLAWGASALGKRITSYINQKRRFSPD